MSLFTAESYTTLPYYFIVMVGICFIVSAAQQLATWRHLPHPTPSDDLTSPETSQNITSHTLSGHSYGSTNYHAGHNALRPSKVQWHDMVDIVGCGTSYTSLEHFRIAVNSLLQLISSCKRRAHRPFYCHIYFYDQALAAETELWIWKITA